MRKEINETLGCRVKQIRKEKGYTREQLAEKISVSTRFLADVEIGNVGVSLVTLKSMAIVLGVSADFLLGIVDDNFYDKRQSIVNKINRIENKYIDSTEILIDSVLQIINTNTCNKKSSTEI